MKFIALLLPFFLMACSNPPVRHDHTIYEYKIKYGSRAAYVSKSARVRIKDNQWKTVGSRSSDYGLSLDNLLACDEELIKLGFIKK